MATPPSFVQLESNLIMTGAWLLLARLPGPW